MVILALDLSLKQSGGTIFDENAKIVKIFTVSTNDKDALGARLKVIADYMAELRKEFAIDKVIIERAFSRFNVATAMIFRVHGICNMIFWDCEQIYYAPKTIKKFILNGNATKKQVQEKIKEVYKDIEFMNEDESDAVAICLSYFIDKKLINWN
jgi:Holliday junction resolvasome RuvABC endonuclease subunit